MIVVSRDEGVDGDKAVAAGTVLDDDRLPPALREPVRQQARTDIGAAAGAKGQNETDRPGRPVRGGRRSGHARQDDKRAEDERLSAQATASS